MQTLYSVLYHGGLSMSTPGGMSLGSRCGIQTHDDFNQAACYSILSQIGIPGVWFQVVFEIARRCGKQFPEKVGKKPRMH